MSAPFPLPLFDGKRPRLLPRNNRPVREPERIEIQSAPTLQREQLFTDLLGDGFPDNHNLAELLEKSEERQIGYQVVANDHDRPSRPPTEFAHPEEDIQHPEMPDLGGPFLGNNAQFIERRLQFLKQTL